MANAIRALAMDAVEKANSGHPGLPMGAADIATVLFTRFLKFDPADPAWPDRDRFVLSAGHGSMLLYALLYLVGYEKMTIEAIKRFRQLGSLTPGHPEYGHTPGVETTTGPLGQGLGNAVGMAIAERHLAAEFGSDIVDHYTYVLASDGDLMEGISQEAIALAGHLKLKKLIVLYDDNGISIDGPTRCRLRRPGEALRVPPAGCRRASMATIRSPIAAALEVARKSDRPTMIACRTTIGFGAPKKGGTEKSHGSALGAEEDRSRPQEARLAVPAIRNPSRHHRAMARCRRARPSGSLGVGTAPRRTTRRTAHRVRAPHPRRVAGKAARRGGARAEANAQYSAQGNRHALGFRVRARSSGPVAARNGRRIGRPHRFQQHPREGHESLERHGLCRPLHPLWRARTRHGSRHERYGTAWGHHPLFRDVPGFLRLLPPVDPACRADGPARHPCDDPRFDRARRGRPDASAG